MGYCATQQSSGERKSDVPFIHEVSPLFQQSEIPNAGGRGWLKLKHFGVFRLVSHEVCWQVKLINS
jgi:hypothetical protein